MAESGYYDILGLQRTSTNNEVKDAFRKLSLKWHPDKHDDKAKTLAEQKFRQIAEAYTVLSDRTLQPQLSPLADQFLSRQGQESFIWVEFFVFCYGFIHDILPCAGCVLSSCSTHSLTQLSFNHHLCICTCSSPFALPHPHLRTHSVHPYSASPRPLRPVRHGRSDWRRSWLCCRRRYVPLPNPLASPSHITLTL